MCAATDAAPGSEMSSALMLSESDSEPGAGAEGNASSARTAAKRKLLFSPAHKRVVKKVSCKRPPRMITKGRRPGCVLMHTAAKWQDRRCIESTSRPRCLKVSRQNMALQRKPRCNKNCRSRVLGLSAPSRRHMSATTKAHVSRKIPLQVAKKLAAKEVAEREKRISELEEHLAAARAQAEAAREAAGSEDADYAKFLATKERLLERLLLASAAPWPPHERLLARLVLVCPVVCTP